MRGKRAQFFILAAVILSSIIVSLAATRNYVIINREPDRFYDLSEQIKEESGRVVDFSIVNDADKLKDFSEKISQNIYEQEPDASFVFIYGDSSNLTIENYGLNKSVFESGNISGNLSGGGQKAESKIRLDVGDVKFHKKVIDSYKDYTDTWWGSFNPNVDKVRIKVNNQNYDFSLKNRQQFLMIMTKEARGERYVDVK